MPTYEYICDACGNKFEKFQSMSSAPIKKCPKCGKIKVRRLIGTGAGLIFKGSGFYITDYRDSGYNDKAKADNAEGKPTAADAKSETKSDAKSDSKSEAKTETKSEAKSESKSESKAESKSESGSKSSSESKGLSKSESKRSDSSKSEKKK